MESERLTLTVNETARILGLSRNTAYRAILSNEIPHIKIGKRILVPKQMLNKLLDGDSTALGVDDGR